MYAACHNAAQKQYPSIKVGDYEGFERMSFFFRCNAFPVQFHLGVERKRPLRHRSLCSYIDQ